MISSLWPPAVVGGAELYACDLAAQLRAQGHDVGVVTHGVEGDDVVTTIPAWPARVDELPMAAGWRGPAFHLRDVWRPQTLRILRRAIEQFRPHVIHSHVTSGMSVAALVAPSALGVPHVHTLHDYWLRCWRTTLTKRSGASCGTSCRAIAAWRSTVVRRGGGPDVVIAISRAMLEQHPDIRGRIDTRVVHHPTQAVHADGRAARSDARPLFGYLGQLATNKGLDVLVDAAALGNHQLLVAGRGPLEPLVRRASGVDYLGWVSGDDRESFFDRIDCLVVPSVWHEPAGLAVNEEYARGIQVIASAVGGLPEYVPDACRPLLTPPGDPASLAGAMTRFADEPERFAPGVPAPERGWGPHLDEIVDAYKVAGAS